MSLFRHVTRIYTSVFQWVPTDAVHSSQNEIQHKLNLRYINANIDHYAHRPCCITRTDTYSGGFHNAPGASEPGSCLTSIHRAIEMRWNLPQWQ